MSSRSVAALLLSVLAAACQAEGSDDLEASDQAIGEDGEELGVPAAFDRNHIVDDDFYRDTSFADADQIQRFLESTPHRGVRSWLADARIGDLPAAEAIVRAARAHGLNPVVVLARMQVESSIIAKTEEPVGRAGQFALGCHKESAQYPNGLDPAVAPLDIQLECGTRTLENLFAAASAGTNRFPVGRPGRTLDGITVTPSNVATSALYSYTPFVAEGTGGNWLVWNVTRRYAAQIRSQSR